MSKPGAALSDVIVVAQIIFLDKKWLQNIIVGVSMSQNFEFMKINITLTAVATSLLKKLSVLTI